MAPISLKSNIASLSGQRQLSKTSNLLGDVYKRLSSGQRINRAVDDAAGLAIASSLGADSRLYTQAIRNINDAVSALTIADAAYSELAGITGRIIELAEQSANGVYSTQQRLTLDTEAQSLAAEYKRIVQTTSFNGTNLLDGSSTSIDVQVGVSKDASSRVAAEFGEAATTTAGDGTFSTGTAHASVVGNRQHSTIADMNGDGNLDLIVTGRSTNRLNVLLGNGDGSFGSAIITSTGASPIGVTVNDVNNDGVQDAVLAIAGTNAIEVYIGNNNGTFQAAASYALNENVDSESLGDRVALGDFNGDSYLDIAVGTESDDRVEVLINNGNGTYGAATAYGGFGEPKSLVTADINKDGNLDIVASESAVGVVFLAGNGNGTFAAAVGSASSSEARDIALGDFNGDGNFDLVQATNLGVNILIGNGAGNFTETANLSPAGTIPINVAIGDLNGDGNDDFIASDNVFIGNGDGTFQAAYTYVSALGSGYGVNLGDFNNDNALDILFSSPTYTFLGNTQNIPGLQPFSLQTASEARSALDRMKGVLEKLAQARGTLGASESRLQTAARNDIAQKEGSEAARAQIMDADIADTSALATRTSLLQQVSSAILAQANQQPQLALQLLSL